MLETQRRALAEMQVELEGAIRRYADLYDNLPIALVTLTTKGRIVEANATALQWLRRERAQLIGSYFNGFLDPFDAGRLAAHLESAPSRSAAGSMIELTLRLADGLMMTVQLSSRVEPAGADGGSLIHTAITNISKLRQAHRVLDDISREQENVSQSIAQDLRAPVITISDHARNLLEEHRADLTIAVREAIERMEGAACRLESAAQHLLEYCLLGTAEVAADPVSVDDVIQMVMMEHRALIHRRHADVQVARPLPCVRGSRLILGQVFSHVLKQAINCAGEGDLPRVGISAVVNERKANIRITGSGRQLAADSERVFSIYDQGPDGAGGVCLAVVRRAVERMQGRVWIESPPGGGTCFCLELMAVG